MLTQNEKNWLEERQNICLRCRDREYCRTGKRHGYNTKDCRFWKITVPGSFSLRYPENNYKDVAEFEARVAAELATIRMEINWGENFSCCPPTMTRRECSTEPSIDCQWCHLKYARIAVEAKMEAENGPVF